jgi:hypothetical protein
MKFSGGFLTTNFPLSYFMLIFGFLIGIGASAVIFGSVSLLIGLFLVWFGILRILPIVEACSRVLNGLFPGVLDTIEKNIGDSFPVEAKGYTKKGIYIFHPHGLFSLAHFFHIGTDFTEWPVRPIRGTAIHWILWLLPFGKELLEFVKFVPSYYSSMKSVLEGGESLSVTLGGVREILYSEPGKMKLAIKKRRGIFKMAIETGTPLVPVLCYGENELYETFHSEWLDWIQDKLIDYALFIPIPTWKSVKNWLGLYGAPLAHPVKTVVGEAIEVGEARSPTEDEISELRETYFKSLRKLYTETKPSWYADTLEIV